MNLTKMQHCALVAAIAAALFMMLALPVVFSMTAKMSPAFMEGGAPSTVGVVVHGVVFFLIFFGILCLLSRYVYSPLSA